MMRMRIDPRLGDGAGQARAASPIAPRHERRHSAQKGMRAEAGASAGAIVTWRSRWSGNISDGAPRGSARRESVRPGDAGRLAGVLASRFRAPGWFPPSGRGTGGRTDCKPMKRIGVAQAGGFVKSGTPERLAVCHAGRVEIRFPPHEPHRRRWATLGTVTLSASASTLTSALCPQASHVAITARTPFSRMFARVMGGPCFSRATIPNAHAAPGRAACPREAPPQKRSQRKHWLSTSVKLGIFAPAILFFAARDNS